MTTIAIKKGMIASDAQTTTHTEEGGSRLFKCVKLYRKFVGTDKEAILGTSGESFSSLVFVDWYGTDAPRPEVLLTGEADFTVIALTHAGLFEYDKWCRGEEIIEPMYAIGSGAKAALGAMHAGCSAKRAVEIACLIDPFSRPPVTVMKLARPKATKAKPSGIPIKPPPSMDS